jgi:hypothetical protein
MQEFARMPSITQTLIMIARAVHVQQIIVTALAHANIIHRLQDVLQALGHVLVQEALMHANILGIIPYAVAHHSIAMEQHHQRQIISYQDLSAQQAALLLAM